MTLTYRSTVGRRLTVTEGDGNIAHLAGLGGVNVTNPPYNGGSGGDDTAAIQTALNTGRSVFIPYVSSGYRISSTLVVSTAGQRVIGEGIDAVRIYTTSNIKMMRISALRVQVDGFELDGNNAATHCLILHNAGEGITGRIRCDAATVHNILFNTISGGGSGGAACAVRQGGRYRDSWRAGPLRMEMPSWIATLVRMCRTGRGSTWN